MKKSLVSLLMVPSLLLGAVVGVNAETQVAYAAVAPNSTELADARTSILNQTNAARANAGLAPLVANAALNTIAQGCSETQATNNVLAHCDGFQDRYPAGWYLASENVGRGSTVNQIFTGWMNSAGHKANITASNATDIGIGFYYADNGQIYLTQNFAGYSSTKTAPSRVGGIAVSPNGNGAANVTFVAPSSNGNSPITRYDIQAVSAGNPTVTTSTGATPGTYPITGLKGGVTYNVSVRAVNAIGAGAWSPITTVTATGVPSVFVSSIDVTTSEATVNFTTNNGGLALNNITVTLSSRPNATISADKTSYVFTGLKPGSSHTGTVYATNSAGNSEAIPFAFTTLATAPDAPTTNSIVENATNLKVSWTEPTFNGGSNLTGYKVRLYDASSQLVSEKVVASTVRSNVFLNLVRGQTYSYDVTAVNSAGSTTSNRNSINIPFTAPSATQNFVAALTDEQQIALTWVAPKDNGGKAIVDYVVTVIANGSVQSTKRVTGTNTTFNSAVINSDTTYTFSIVANNGSLVGPASFSGAVVVPVTPTVSTPVRGLTATNITSSSFNISWTSPVNNGGTAITGYRYVVTNVLGNEVAKATVSDTTTSASLTNLNRYTEYNVNVYAINAKGASSPTTTVVKTAAELPTGSYVTDTTYGQQPGDVTFEVATSDNGGDSNLTYSFGLFVDDMLFTKTSSTNKATFNNIPSDRTYQLTIVASNSAGASETNSTVDVNSVSTPSEPLNLSASVTGTDLNINWMQPLSEGSFPVGSYNVTIRDLEGNILFTDATINSNLTVDLKGQQDMLNGETYVVQVTSVSHNPDYPFSLNSGFQGKNSEINYTVPATTPFAVNNLETVYGNRNINVTWVAPTRDGGAEIETYTVKLYDKVNNLIKTLTVPASTTEVNFTNVSAKTSYFVVVIPNNVVGAGEASSSALKSTGVFTPSAPVTSTSTLVEGTNIIRTEISGVADNGGEALTGYAYSVYNVTDNVVAVTQTATAKTSVNFVGANGKTYRFTVYAVNSAGVGNAHIVNPTVTIPLVAPSEPTNVTATDVTDANATLNWSAPANNGGVNVTSYNIKLTDENNVVMVEDTVSDVNSYRFNGLEANTEYAVEISANNSIGSGNTVAFVFISDYGVAPAVTNVKFALSGPEATMALVNWTAPEVGSNVESLLEYDVQVVNVNDGSVIFSAENVSSTSVIAYGLVRGETYEAKVSANFVYPGTESPYVISDEKVTVAYVAPSAVNSVTVFTDGKLVPTVTWNASSDNGGLPVTYDVVIADKNNNVVLDVTTEDNVYVAAEALSPSTTYNVTVTANNSVGASAPTSVSFTTAAIAPTAARNVNAVASETTVDATWDAPSNDGGGTVDYSVVIYNKATVKEIARFNNITGTSASFTGLTRGETYYVAVTANNSVGSASAKSSNDVFVTPTAPENAFFTTTTVNNVNNINVAWGTPSYDGGSAITGYRLVLSDSNNKIVTTVETANNVRAYTFNADKLNILPNANYTVSIQAFNSFGESSSSTTAVETKVLAPSAPRNTLIEANQSDSTISYSFGTSAKNGGETVVYSYKIVNTTDDVVIVSNDTAAPDVTDTIIVPRGKTYVLTVTATNSAGAKSASSTVNVNAVPASAVTDIVVNNITADNAVNFSWTAPVNNGGATITSYKYEVIDAAGKTVVTGDTAKVTVDVAAGVLAPNKTYSVSVKAVNSAGVSDALVATNVIKTNIVAPKAAVIGNIAVTFDTATVTYTLPTDLGGDTTSSHYVTLSHNGSVLVTGSTDNPIEFTDLTHATEYVVNVTVENSVGQTTASENFTTNAIAPAAPTDVTSEITGKQSANVTWIAPEDDGGSAITGYVVTYVNADKTVTGNKTVTVSRTATSNRVASGNRIATEFTDLPLGNDYVFTVKAVNSAGVSDASVVSSSVTTAPATNVVPLDEKTFLSMLDSIPVLTVALNGDVLTVNVPDATEFDWFAGFSYPTFGVLDWSFVANGNLTYNVSDVAAGTHYLALYTADGQLYGAGEYTIAAEPVKGEEVPPVTDDKKAEVTPNAAPTQAEKSNKLSYTGADYTLPLGLGSILLISGLGLAYISRRKNKVEVS